MTKRSEFEIPLPADPLLRVLALYGIGAGAVLLVLPILTRVLGLPAWLGRFAFAILVLGAPVVALVTWLWERRR